MAKKKRPRRSARDWAREVAAWRRSGGSAKAYAKRHGLKASTLSWWTWKLRRDGVAVDNETREVSLVPVEVVDDQGPGELERGWELVTAEGHRLRGHGDLARETVAALVRSVVREA